jgi:small subunit ribosomal protein S17
MTTESARGRRHLFSGVVISDKTDKTRVVTVQRTVRDAQYEKVQRKRSKFYVHDEKNESHVGDLVEIMGARPMSRLKRWRLVRVVKAAPRLGPAVAAAEAAVAKEGAS